MKRRPASESSFPGRWSRLRPLAVFLVLAAAVALAAPRRIWTPVQTIAANAYVLDDSWRLELPARLGQGSIAGRDFIFTYGVLRQILSGAGWLIPPHDVASVLRFQGLGEAVAAVCALWVLLALTGAPLAFRAVGCLAWAALLPTEVKPLAGLALVSTLVSRLGAPIGRDRLRPIELAGWAFGAPALALYSFDLGLMTLAALVAAAAGVAAAAALRRDPLRAEIGRRALVAAGAAALGFGFFAAFLAVLPGWSRTLADLFALTKGYAEKSALPILRPAALNLLASAAAAIAVTVWAFFRVGSGADRESARPRSFALLSAGLFGLLWTRYGLSRSDDIHVFLACLPALLASALLLPCELRARRTRGASLIFAAGLAACAWMGQSTPADGFPYTDIPPPPLLLDGGRIRVEQPAVQEALSLLRPDAPPDLLVFPFETMINVLAGKRSPTATLHLYSANTDELERRTVRNLLSRPETPALFFTTGWQMDGVENVNRSPLVFRHLLDHYELDGEPGDGVALLRPAPAAAPRWTEERLRVPPVSGSPAERRDAEVLLPDDCCRMNDFVVVRLRLSKTPYYGLFKPGAVFVGFRFDVGPPRLQRLAVSQDGETHTFVLSPVTSADPLFLSAFQPGRAPRARERLLGIGFRWVPMDLLSRPPAAMTVESVAVLRRNVAVAGDSSTASGSGSR